RTNDTGGFFHILFFREAPGIVGRRRRRTAGAPWLPSTRSQTLSNSNVFHLWPGGPFWYYGRHGNVSSHFENGGRGRCLGCAPQNWHAGDLPHQSPANRHRVSVPGRGMDEQGGGHHHPDAPEKARRRRAGGGLFVFHAGHWPFPYQSFSATR